MSRMRVVLAGVVLVSLSGGHASQGEDPPPKNPVADGARAGEVRDDNGPKMAFVWCPPGEFAMGSPKDDRDRFADEDQVRATLTKGFWLGRTEVTQEQWRSVMGFERWKGQANVKEGPTVAATWMSFDDSLAFCRMLTEQERKAGRLPEGWEYRLPTEAEWEYACRAGSGTAYSFDDDASRLAEYAWYERNSRLAGESHPHPVGAKKPNAWGLHDMHGNVWEWCADCWKPELPGGRDPVGPTSCVYRVIRGGGWFSPSENCRSANRRAVSSGVREDHLGFRVVLAPVREAKTE